MNEKELNRISQGGIFMLEKIMDGGDPTDCWDMLAEKGYNEEERVEIAKTVQAFMRHKNGDHSSCRGTCDATRDIQSTVDSVRSKPSQSADPKAEFSSDIQEEWK